MNNEKPILQVALDFVDTQRALKLAAEAVAGGCDWLEAGTPLIKSEGLNVIRELRKNFPGSVIVADMKTMDAGKTEVEIAAKSGASVVGILGTASDETIKEAVAAAKNYGVRILVDMISVVDVVKRAKEAQALGADYIGVHIPIDEQMRGDISFESVKKVAEAVDIPVAAAGGINSETAAAVVKAGASIVVVGGAITKSVDAKKAAAEIKKAITEKKAIESRYFKRAGPDNLREVLSKVSVANISDALHRGSPLKGLRAILTGAKICGPAVTVKTLPGDWAKPVRAIEQCKEGDILVIDASGVGPAVWGELATQSAILRKLTGVVIWGAVRDVAEIRELKFPAYAKLITPQAGEPKGFGEINVPITIEGALVSPGDWIAADDDGVIVLPKVNAVEISNRAMDVLEKENRLRSEILSGKTLSELAELLKWEKK